jgi:hypothetical protein
MMELKDGQMEKVNVLKMIVIGSKTMRLRFLSRAAIKRAMSRRYFPFLQDSFMLMVRFLRIGNISITLPNGHNQPHQALPKTSAKIRNMNASAIPGMRTLAARLLPNITNGLSLKGMDNKVPPPSS